LPRKYANASRSAADNSYDAGPVRPVSRPPSHRHTVRSATCSPAAAIRTCAVVTARPFAARPVVPPPQPAARGPPVSLPTASAFLPYGSHQSASILALRGSWIKSRAWSVRWASVSAERAAAKVTRSPSPRAGLRGWDVAAAGLCFAGGTAGRRTQSVG
jgi:hypothetical protein